MKDYKALLSGFLYGGKKEENYIRKLIQVSVNPYMKSLLVRKIGDDYEEELLSELRFRLIKNKDYWQSLEFISLNYLKSMIRNLLVDTINGGRVEVYSLQVQVFEEETAKPLTYEDILKDTRHAFVEAEGNTLFDALMRVIREEDVPVLCYYLGKSLYGVEVELSGLSRDNLYKRWERLRKGRLKEVFDGAEPEELRIAVERFLSEVCEKKGYITNRGMKDGT
ncbi:MAG: hypothetical protein ACK42C_06985 [Aquificaceae bacterium]|jgi:hypothetical protein|uniref:hypothetical protein n=1 Tax=Hydrogenobacter sp. Uz 6-8 TaxID=3384828 RepID=UPI0030B3C2E9